MRRWLPLVLLLLPIAEISVLVTVYGAIAARYGASTALVFTVGALVASGVIGVALARTQGVRALMAVMGAASRGENPGTKLLDVALISAGGALLIVPGYLSDLVGITLLIPGTRRLYARGIERWFRRKIDEGKAAFFSVSERTLDRPGTGEVVIDVTPDEAPDAEAQNTTSPEKTPGSLRSSS
jgi:UPF0716 protein FxsA